LEQYRAKIREHREVEARLKRMREDVKGLTGRYQKTEDDLAALQSVGQIIGDVLKRLDSERFIVKASSGPRYVVGCRSRLNHDRLKPGTRVAVDSSEGSFGFFARMFKEQLELMYHLICSLEISLELPVNSSR
jgi:26S proteasome regulatory subunit T4